MITKDELSDLKSLQRRVVQCNLAVQNDTLALKQAEAQLESFLFNLTRSKLDATPPENNQ